MRYRGAVKLTSVHQLLMAMAIGLALIFGLRSLSAVFNGGGGRALLLLLLALASGAGLLWYLLRFRARLASQQTDAAASE